MSTDKDEILQKITELEDFLNKEREQYARLAETAKNAAKERAVVLATYELVAKQLREKENICNDAKSALEENIRKGKKTKSELEALRREYSRQLDISSIIEKQQEQAGAFRDKCLDAIWRKENRSDGKGAFPHQIDGAILAACSKQAILADPRGLGKSLTSLIWLDLIEAKKVLVICPSDTMHQYIGFIKFWTPHRQIIPLGKISRGERDFFIKGLQFLEQYVIVMNYEAWRKDSTLMPALAELKLDTLILDEAHHIKTTKTITSKGVMDLRFNINDCPGCGLPSISKRDLICKCGHEGRSITEFCSIKNVLPVTGTPILNRPQEIFPLLRLIDPDNFHTERHFLLDFCNKDYTTGHWFWRTGAEKVLVDKLGPRYIARSAKDAGVIIPPIEPVLHVIKMEDLQENYPRQFAAYTQVKEFGQLILDPDREITLSMPLVITLLLRLRQVATWPAGIELRDGDELIARLNVEESAKVDLAETIINEVIEEGERVVLFSQFKFPLQELHNRLGSRSVVYDGSTSKYDRELIQKDFDPQFVGLFPKWDVVLCNYRTAGEGLNLQAASTMVILDEEWSPGKQSQAYGRVNRIGQTRDTTIHTIRIEPSVDTWMAGLIEEKADIIGGFESQAAFARKTYDAILNGEI